MADPALAARSPFPHAPVAATNAEGGVMIAALPESRQSILIARRGQDAALIERCRGFGLTLPATPQRIDSDGVGIVWTGPGQWLVDWDGPEVDRAGRLFAPFASLCTLVRADDARARLSVSGLRARDTLAKMLTLDLHPRAFRPGEAAITVAGGISVVLWQRDETPSYICAVPRSFAGSFWDWLLESAAEYGIRIVDAA